MAQNEPKQERLKPGLSLNKAIEQMLVGLVDSKSRLSGPCYRA